MILNALSRYYERLRDEGNPDIPLYGYSREAISYALTINLQGNLVDVDSLMVPKDSGKGTDPRRLIVPQPPKRSGKNYKPCFLWDKSEYVLGLTQEGGSEERAKVQHQKFVEEHSVRLKDASSNELRAFVKFLEKWSPDDKKCVSKIPEDAIGKNLVFRIDGKRQFLHDTSEAKDVHESYLQLSSDQPKMFCAITGEHTVPARTHPSIKGVEGAQTSGASIVSFNQDSFTSYNKKQGHNAPVSEATTFAYTSMLNYLLRRKSRHKLNMGDTTIVFWAEASNGNQADIANQLMAQMLNPSSDESENHLLRAALTEIRDGKPLASLDMELDPETKIYVLGLAPNASRISIRFWEMSSLDVFAKRLAQHFNDLYLEPTPWRDEPPIWKLLTEIAPHRKDPKTGDYKYGNSSDVPPNLGGEVARAVLTGRRYPRSLLGNIIMRIRADGDLSNLRIALCKAVLVRDARLNNQSEEEIPMTLNTENKDPGYLLGRLFASLEAAQYAALGGGTNSTIRDRYFGAASATPASVFPVLFRNAQNHLSKIRKDKPGLAVTCEKNVEEIMNNLSSEFPKSMRLDSQGHFVIGYYHQKAHIYSKHREEDQP